MDPMTMLGVAGGALAATGIASDLGNLGINFLNYKEQQATREQNERLMREAWARDDTARTRMVADLENAGLSKWLATGASPSQSSPVSLSAPQMQGFKMDALQHSFDNALHTMQTKASTDLQEKQGDLADASTAVAEAEKKIKEEELNIKKQEARIKEHDANVWTNRPSVASNDPAPMRYIVEGSNLITGNSDAGNGVRNWLDGFFSGQGTGNGEVTNPPVQPPSKPSKPAESKQQKEIQKLKGKEHKFMTYQEWLNNQGINKGYYEKHPKEAWNNYQSWLTGKIH